MVFSKGDMLGPLLRALGFKDGPGGGRPVVSEDQVGAAVALDYVRVKKGGQGTTVIARVDAHFHPFGEHVQGHKEHLSTAWRDGHMGGVHPHYLKEEGRHD